MCKYNCRRNTDLKNDQSVDAWKTEQTPPPPHGEPILSPILQFLFLPHGGGFECSSFKPKCSFTIKKVVSPPLCPQQSEYPLFPVYCLGGAMPPKARKEDECRSSRHCVTPGFVQRKVPNDTFPISVCHLQALAPREHLMGFCHGTGFLG